MSRPTPSPEDRALASKILARLENGYESKHFVTYGDGINDIAQQIADYMDGYIEQFPPPKFSKPSTWKPEDDR